MSHWIIAPVLLPAMMAVLLLLVRGVGAQRILGGVSIAGLVAVGLALVGAAAGGHREVYELGHWPAPFGIVLVLDRLSALMLLLTSVVASAAFLYAVRGWDEKGRHFHALLQFQLMGVNGAFLTGDLFNLFVFFEVLLIASYGLLLHGSGPARLRAGFHYVVINLAASSLFLVAVSLLYALTGTLNMADLAVKVALLPERDAGLAQTAGLLLLAVFGVKAALFPLYFWLPSGYAAASAPVAAFFAIMTKVGVYAILRVYTLIFGVDAGVAADLAVPWLLPVALVTLAIGTLGAIGSCRLDTFIAYLTVASVGTILTAVGLFSLESVASGLYYMIHSTLVVAALFLLADMVAAQRGDRGLHLRRGPPLAQPVALGLLFVVAAAAMGGLPPLSGFIGKLMILESALNDQATYWVWAIVLVSGLLTLIAISRAGSMIFWNTREEEGVTPSGGAPALAFLPVVLLAALLITLSIAAQPVKNYTDATAQQLLEPKGYIDLVLHKGVPQ